VLKLHIDGGERVEIYLIIHGDTRVHAEVETGPSKDTNPRSASYSAAVGANNRCGGCISLVCTQFAAATLGESNLLFTDKK
jgi:hypothetical protein